MTERSRVGAQLPPSNPGKTPSAQPASTREQGYQQTGTTPGRKLPASPVQNMKTPAANTPVGRRNLFDDTPGLSGKPAYRQKSMRLDDTLPHEHRRVDSLLKQTPTKSALKGARAAEAKAEAEAAAQASPNTQIRSWATETAQAQLQQPSKEQTSTLRAVYAPITDSVPKPTITCTWTDYDLTQSSQPPTTPLASDRTTPAYSHRHVPNNDPMALLNTPYQKGDHHFLARAGALHGPHSEHQQTPKPTQPTTVSSSWEDYGDPSTPTTHAQAAEHLFKRIEGCTYQARRQKLPSSTPDNTSDDFLAHTDSALFKEQFAAFLGEKNISPQDSTKSFILFGKASEECPSGIVSVGISNQSKVEFFHYGVLKDQEAVKPFSLLRDKSSKPTYNLHRTQQEGRLRKDGNEWIVTDGIATFKKTDLATRSEEIITSPLFWV